jgi:[ribosomal protein S18]-alanine N-acetyltransferase
MKITEQSHGNLWEISGVGQDAILIRRLNPDDLADALEIDQEVFGGYDLSIFSAFYEYHSKTSLVAEMNGKVVGFILGFMHTLLEGRVFWLAVKPACQSRGIATKLLIAILSIFRQMGAVSATLEVRISNKKAQSIYSWMGFQMTGIHPSYYSDGEAALIMKRSL